MKAFFLKIKINPSKKISLSLLTLLVIFVLSVYAFYPRLAWGQVQVYGGPVTTIETVSTPQITTQVKQTFWQRLVKSLQKAGSIAFQRVLSSSLNKIAYDAANYIGSGDIGQKPLFVKEDLGQYLLKVGDEAAGQFLETFVNNINNPTEANCEAKVNSCYASCMEAGGVTSVADEICFDGCDKANTRCVANPTGTYGAGNIANSATPSFNVCQPSSISAKLKIGLGLVEQTRPQGPNCTISNAIRNWDTAADLAVNRATATVGAILGNDNALSYLYDKDYLDNFVDFFDPRANDLGIYLTTRSDMFEKLNKTVNITNTEFVTTGGWKDVRDIAGLLKGTPGEARTASEQAREIQQQSFGKTTGDILVDAANVFLNQLYISAYNNLMQNLSKKAAGLQNSNPAGYQQDPNVVFGETNLKEITSSLLTQKFNERADYDILSELSICLDSKNPGPDNCVIDSEFMSAIAEKKTVAEAIKDGNLHESWQFTLDNRTNSYTLRNISILRKYRIVPVGWEVAIKKAYENVNSPKKASLMDLVSCFDPKDKYVKFSSDFDRRDLGWCEGLVDPNWVLKAPLNYCEKEGVGSQIISKSIMPGSSGETNQADILSELSVVRAEDYCADNKTCVKEGTDGRCSFYGYCNEEKRTWNFNNDSCDPIYNTCQSFNNTDNGQAVSYLQNTLNYANCNSESAGCRQYAIMGSYATSTDTVNWYSANSVYLNKNIAACNNKDEGCTELLRVKATWGGNLIMNANFGTDYVSASSTGAMLGDWPIYSTGSSLAEIVDTAVNPGSSSGKALKLSGSGAIGIESNNRRSLLPSNFQTIPGVAYTLSADIYLVSGESVSLFLGDRAQATPKIIQDKNGWRHVSITKAASETYNEPFFSIIGSGGSVVFYLQNLKFEVGDWATNFTAYGSFKIYEKLLPNYLEKTCYVNAESATKDYNLKAGAPAVCSQYARKCNREEVGCELYTAIDKNLAIPAQATSLDYCPSDCLGYDVYVSKETQFAPPQAENLIPQNTTICASNYVGCTEFTNLDELARGGEAKEYYTYLKQCIKPATDQCASFYSWAGTENGYQLQAVSLKKDANGTPFVTSDDSSLCNAQIYNLPLSDARYNSDCREFYNAAGQVSYHLVSRTVTCSDDCHAYRLSEKNADKRLTVSECVGVDKHWEASLNTCYVCQNGGKWDATQQACVYQAIPGEGKICSATENGCREYNGNGGNNVRLSGYYDFENGLAGWSSNCSNGVSTSTISNSKNGHSLQYNFNASSCGNIGSEPPIARRRLIEEITAADRVAAQLKLGYSVSQGAAYTVKFLARAASEAELNLYLLNADTGEKAYFNAASPIKIKGGNEWNLYQANLDNLNHKVGVKEFLILAGSGDFYLDNFILSEITDRYYFIKGTSQIPDVCYYDNFDVYQGADYNLGCASYTDRGGLTHNLHQFSKLCANSAVGCEQMIDTKNYNPYGSGTWNDTNENGVCDSNEKNCYKVNGDSSLYAVYEPTKQCNYADSGCSRLGKGQGEGQTITWVDVYRRNDPDQYNKILCGQEDVGCEEWKNVDDGSLNYFKNPSNAACVYRSSQDPEAPGKAWYKIPVKRCDSNKDGKIEGAEKGTAVCGSDSFCNGKPCIIDTNDYFCSVSYFKTIGLGGGGNQLPVPDQEAGLCEPVASGCSEYIDPISQFSPNSIYNPNYLLINSVYDGWGTQEECSSLAPAGSGQQMVRLTPNSLYSFLVKTDNGNNGNAVNLNFPNGSYVKPLLADNTFGTSTVQLSIPAYIAASSTKFIFHSLGNTCAIVSGGAAGKTIEIKELVVDYQLKSNLDPKTCNGATKFDNGCILFNERQINGASGLAPLTWDAYATIDGQAPVPSCDAKQSGACTANKILKVRPDRVCAKWLECTSYSINPETGERSCYSVGECNRLNDKNECASFVGTLATTTRQFDINRDKNASGYTLVDQYYLEQMKEVGVNSEAHYDFEDAIPALSCLRGLDTSNKGACDWDSNITKNSLVREPEKSPTDYPAHGKTYLKVFASYQISPISTGGYIKLENNKEKSDSGALNSYSSYYLNYLVNTRNSGLGAKVIITDDNNVILTDLATNKKLIFFSTANNGWERKIVKFNLSGGQRIRIYLTSDTTDPKDDSYVYFDDINLEPVLETGENQYVARECRLYPTSDSLTCINKNQNVIKGGLEGYCLEHDSSNLGNCLLWYPIDKISSAQNSLATSGYQGKYPLNYCTNVNANFSLVEKRQATKIFDNGLHNACGVCDDNDCGPNGTWCFFPENTNLSEATIMYPNCAGRLAKNGEISETINNVTYKSNFSNAFNWGSFSHGYPGLSTWFGLGMIGDYFSCGPDNTHGSPDYFLVVQRYRDCAKDDDNPTGKNHFNYCVACVPMSTGKRLLATTQEWIKCETEGNTLGVPQNSGWYRYDGLQCNPPGACAAVNEATNVDPPVRVYDYNNEPLTEDNLKLIAGQDAEQLFRLTCNRFVQLVNSDGLNKAWANRVSQASVYPLGTPPYFLTYPTNTAYSTAFALDRYGRRREDVPFGAASWPDNYDLLSSPAITLRDQYSKKNKEEVFAGRPYGCSGTGFNSCAQIGSCSLDANAFCLVDGEINKGTAEKPVNISDPQYVAKSTCAAAGLGICVPLSGPWGAIGAQTLGKGKSRISGAADPDSITILNNLFLEGFNSYELSDGATGLYVATSTHNNYNFDPTINYGPTTINFTGCLNGVRPKDGSPYSAANCYIFPTVSNVKLYYGNVAQSSIKSINIKKGVYRLEFNTKVDSEQQPLRRIFISWGDGSSQVITDQDQHPTIPHVFYHYYRKAELNPVSITIIAYDNWGLYGSY